MACIGFLKSIWPPVRSAKIDNLVFKLYYRYTVLILLVFSFVITCRLLFGYSFSCTNGYDNTMSAYCYTLETPFVVVSELSKQVGTEIMYPGIKKNANKLVDKVVNIPYYPWVNLFFLVLAMLVYLPHLVWKGCEGGLMTRLTSKVNHTSINEAERKLAIVEVAKYIVVTRGGHLLYVGACLISEVLNWKVGVIITISLLNFFNVSSSSEDFEIKTWDDFFMYNFPMAAQCSFHRYGTSGDVQRHNGVCYLYLNKLYGYMFLFLFAWFIMLCVISALVIPYRLLGLVIPPIRLLLFRLRSGVKDQVLLDFVNTQFSLGDWFLLTRLQKNLLPHDITQLLIYVKQNFNKSCTDVEMDDFGKLS